MARVMALDHGTRRVGVAVSDPLGITAQPVGVHDADDFLSALRGLVAEWDVERIVVGLPLGLDGSEGAAADKARAFAAAVAEVSGLETELFDERFSTVVAERAMVEGGARRRRRRDRRDGVAAAVFLQYWLDSHR